MAPISLLAPEICSDNYCRRCNYSHFRPAVESLAVGGKGLGVGGEAVGHVVTVREGIDLIVACTRSVGTITDQNLKIRVELVVPV